MRPECTVTHPLTGAGGPAAWRDRPDTEAGQLLFP